MRPYWLDRLISGIGRDLQLELDAYRVKNGLDPVQTLYRHKGDVPLHPIKDISKEGEFKEIGQGVLTL
ncbi:hypothetical protein ACTWP4_00830 [Gracilibacillus sp. D59]|uniref:hypothetical protein n=1 Tax=Gracilibacillus sp. D59 TaxID=3457434 RepID=UPI003FCD1D0F